MTRECIHPPGCTSCNWCDEFKLPEADHVIHVTDSETIACYRADQMREYAKLCTTECNRRFEELERRVTELERKTVTPGVLWPINKCPKCGIGLEKVMGYVCQRTDCPTGLGSPSSISL